MKITVTTKLILYHEIEVDDSFQKLQKPPYSSTIHILCNNDLRTDLLKIAYKTVESTLKDFQYGDIGIISVEETDTGREMYHEYKW